MKLLSFPVLLVGGCALAASPNKPNIITIIVDDMGYSDLGCYGGEIETPNIDRLANQGVRATQFYTASRSCPTRASLMTGLFQHTAGIGYMSEDPVVKQGGDPHVWDSKEYKGSLNNECVTMGTVLSSAGYHTYMVGKWHLGIHKDSSWPLQRGFDRFYGILAGACNYFQPNGGRGLTLDNKQLPTPKMPYYTTDAFTDYAIDFIDSQDDSNPFFLYLAYNAPHWPLQAKAEDVELFKERYLSKGWDEIREERLSRMKSLGILPEDCGYGEWENRSWDELTQKGQEESAFRMAVYAAQVYSVDQNVGRLLDYLEKNGELDNTLILFMSDNGACAEPMSKELGGGSQSDINNPYLKGNLVSYGRAWAQTAATPFRKYKQRAYEGGISSPLIVFWPKGLKGKENTWFTTPAYMPDIMPTYIEVAGAKYPNKHNGCDIAPLVGKSIIPIVKGEQDTLHEYMFWEHQGNRAVRWGDWKVVWDEKVKEWELYNIAQDRVETNNLASSHSDITKQLSSKWMEWADEYNVIVDFNAEKLRQNAKRNSGVKQKKSKKSRK